VNFLLLVRTVALFSIFFLYFFFLILMKDAINNYSLCLENGVRKTQTVLDDIPALRYISDI
jgi:hypothetical protein